MEYWVCLVLGAGPLRDPHLSEQSTLPPSPATCGCTSIRGRQGHTGHTGAWAPGQQQAGGTRSNHKVVLVGRTKGSCSQDVQGVHEDEGACEVLPALGDGVLHPVQASVQLLDDVPVAVPDLVAPGQQKVIRGFPHGLHRGVVRNGSREQGQSKGQSDIRLGHHYSSLRTIYTAW